MHLNRPGTAVLLNSAVNTNISVSMLWSTYECISAQQLLLLHLRVAMAAYCAAVPSQWLQGSLQVAECQYSNRCSLLLIRSCTSAAAAPLEVVDPTVTASFAW